MFQYADDVWMGTFAKFVDGTSFVRDIGLSDVSGKRSDKFSRKTLYMLMSIP
jgi:hypothetical protein